jgi:hypothetical protein
MTETQRKHYIAAMRIAKKMKPRPDVKSVRAWKKNILSMMGV